MAVCDYMEQHADEFAPFIDESQPFPLYVNNMRRMGVFAGNLELVAFARNYRVDIKVYQLGGNVFVISGAPSDQPNITQRNMPPVHIAYHSYEHYSSVRNRHGPHNGLPKIKASSQDDITPPLEHQPGMVMPKSAAKARPSTTHDSRAADESSPVTPMEKIVMDSTGVLNHSLVRRMLRDQDQGQVIEALVEWTANDDGPWWTADGPADYNGPDHPIEPSNRVELDGAEAPNDQEVPDKQEEPAEQKMPKKPAKGAARQKKAESKKQRKEMAKIKKRKAHQKQQQQQQQGTTTAASDGEEIDISKHMKQVYI
ncbi:2-oxoglutarate dehydrogenase E1 component [Linderina macrospora]|uniref:2-oxoglutarate dehydrogenase E1 component n=1 Tax=Linderina macrospora TaxID=4868 RepID=A0ACC1J2A2_9FUNG|nr:2-oxoglutarate dehydrogenase E1 component [Linderina macrospora]